MITRKSSIALSVAIIAAIGIIIITVKEGSLFLRKDQSSLRSHFLSITPIGSSSEFVLQRLSELGYSPIRRHTGFLRQERGKHAETIGVTSISANIGDYWIPFFQTTNVTIYWGFDSGGKLIDIWTWKTTDAP